MIPIPLTVTVYDRGAAGAFGWQNPVSLAGRLTSYEDGIEARGGFVSLRISFRCSAAELKEWLDAGLLRGMRSYTPRGRLRWEGALVELKATIGPIVITRSLDDMANVLLVSYGSDAGGTGNTSAYSSAASIAEYGTKMLQADLSTTTATGAANWAQTELTKSAWPQRTREVTLDGDGGGDITIELRAVGRYELLDWLLTSNTSTTTTATNTQAVALLTAYNAVNAWFSTSAADIIATGHSDTEYIDPYTSYKEKLETLLSQGNSSKQALAWGIYEGGALTVKVWAGATPSTVSYYRDARDKTVRDPYGNVIDPWDVLPDAMVEDVAILGMAEDAAAIATETREYVARVGLRINSSGVQLTMEPDVLSTTSPAAVAEAIQHPVGRGVIDRSSRASTIGRAIKKKTRTIHQSTDNPKTPTLTGGGSIDLGGGSITAPGGVITITPPGGGTPVTIPTSGGSLLGGSGTAGQLAKWTASDTLGNATAGTDYSAPGHTHTSTDITNWNEAVDDRVGSLLLAGTGISLSYNDAGNSLTISNTGGTVGGTGTAGRIAQWATGGADIENSTLIKSSAGVLTLSAASAYTLTINSSGTLALGGNTLTLNSSLTFNSGTTGRLAGYTGTGTLDDSTVAKTGAGVLTLAVASSLTLTLSGGSATLDFTTPSSGDALVYDGTKFTPTAISAAPTNATYITQTSNGTLSNEQALASLATGMMRVTTATGVVSSVTGTSGRITEWSSASQIGSSTLAKTGAGVITIDADSSYTATIEATGKVVMGFGIDARVAYWGSTNGIKSNAGFTFDEANLSIPTAYKVGANQVVGGRRTGWAAASGTATRSTFATSTVTLAVLAEHVKALIDDLISHGLIGT